VLIHGCVCVVAMTGSGCGCVCGERERESECLSECAHSRVCVCSSDDLQWVKVLVCVCGERGRAFERVCALMGVCME